MKSTLFMGVHVVVVIVFRHPTVIFNITLTENVIRKKTVGQMGCLENRVESIDSLSP